MSDFLMRLVQRQLGQIPSIEPRVPEMYERVTAAMPLPITQETPAEPSDARSIIGAPKVVEDANSTKNLPRVLVELRQPELARANRVSQDKMTLRSQEPVVEASTERVSSEGAPLVTWQSAEVPRATSALAPVIDPAALPVGEKPEQRVATSEMITAPTVRFLVPPAEPRLKSPEQVRLVVAPPRLELKGSDRGELGARERAPVDSEAPVHVSIGRIEVTAVTAAPAPRRSVTARKPAMSLDDYLARHQRGER